MTMYSIIIKICYCNLCICQINVIYLSLDRYLRISSYIFKNLKQHQAKTGCGNAGFEKESFQCHQCPKSFTTKYILTDHIKVVHEGVKSKFCTQCSYSTYNSYNLKLHISKVHLGKDLEKKVCPYCEKTTTNLENHLSTYHIEQLNK